MRNSNNNDYARMITQKSKANLASKNRAANQRAGLRPRVQPGKAKTTFKAAKAPQGKLKSPTKKTANQGKAKAISQALALKRLNKARATLQKAVKAVDDANRNLARGDVAVKFNNRGPSGRGRGKVNVVRDTLKKEKPATSLDDRFSQLLKNAARSTNRPGRGGRGGGNRRGGAAGGNRGGGARRNNQGGRQPSNR